MPNHTEAVNILMKELIDMHIVSSLDEIEGVGHRIVHGGSEFTDSVVLNDDVIKMSDEQIYIPEGELLNEYRDLITDLNQISQSIKF